MKITHTHTREEKKQYHNPIKVSSLLLFYSVRSIMKRLLFLPTATKHQASLALKHLKHLEREKEEE